MILISKALSSCLQHKHNLWPSFSHNYFIFLLPIIIGVLASLTHVPTPRSAEDLKIYRHIGVGM